MTDYRQQTADSCSAVSRQKFISVEIPYNA